MEVLISACITTIGTVVVAIIAYNYKIKTIYNNCDTTVKKFDAHEKYVIETKGYLSKEHGNLAGEHEALSKDHVNLSKQQDKMEAQIDFIKSTMIEEKTKEAFRYENLSKQQLDLVNVAEQINAMGQEIKNLSLKLAEKETQLEFLKQENMELKEKLERSDRDFPSGKERGAFGRER